MMKKTNLLKSCWHYRYFIVSSIKTELMVRFLKSKLGGAWVIINPLVQVLMYALVLSNVLAAKLPGIENKYTYAIYLMAGMLCWSFFSEIISRCLVLYIGQANLLKKVSFPKITLPAIAIGSCLVNYVLLFIAIVVIFIMLGHTFSWVMLWLVPVSILLIMFSASLGLILGTFNVFIRDVGEIVPIMLQMLFWFTPIIYPIEIIPEAYQEALTYSPLFVLVNAYQKVLVFGQAPAWQPLLVLFGLSIILLLLAAKIYYRASEEMADVL